MSEWKDWLAELKAGAKGPVGTSDGLPVAVRGLAWSMPVEIEGDWTDATLAGTVRSSPDAGSALATFSVSGPVVADGFSTFTVSLASGSGANSTGGLPADEDVNGEEKFPYMLLLTPDGGDQELLFGGLLPVIGRA